MLSFLLEKGTVKLSLVYIFGENITKLKKSSLVFIVILVFESLRLLLLLAMRQDYHVLNKVASLLASSLGCFGGGVEKGRRACNYHSGI